MKRLLLFISTVFVVVSCTKEHDRDDALKNDKFVPISLTKAQGEITMNVNSLGFNMLSEIMSKNMSPVSDIMISPLSLSSALAMCVNGAEGRTKEQILDLIGLQDGDVADMNSYYSLMLESLFRADKKVDFISANSLWHQPSITLKKSYKNSIADIFDAELKAVDFSDASSVDIINSWCSSKTNGMIPMIMKKPDPGVAVKLLNALYFKGMWKEEFKETQEKTFRHENGDISTEKTIIEISPFKCAQTPSFKCVEIPYGNGAYVMDLLLPAEDISIHAAAENLARGDWSEISKKLGDKAVHLEFPTFETKYDCDFSEILISLGMIDAFSEEADFSNMTDASLSITSVSQYVSINVTEKGTEASAITDVDFGITSPGPDDGQDEIFEFIANRPFFYLIRESSTGVILFVGIKS